MTFGRRTVISQHQRLYELGNRHSPIAAVPTPGAQRGLSVPQLRRQRNSQLNLFVLESLRKMGEDWEPVNVKKGKGV